MAQSRNVGVARPNVPKDSHSRLPEVDRAVFVDHKLLSSKMNKTGTFSGHGGSVALSVPSFPGRQP